MSKYERNYKMLVQLGVNPSHISNSAASILCDEIESLLHGLGTIAAELGIEAAGDGTDATLIDRVLGAIKKMQRDAARYRHQQVGELLEKAIDASIQNALAAGEAGK